MLKIHQPYKSKYIFAFASIGVLLLGSIVVFGSSEDVVYAAGDSRTIHDIENMQDMTQQICSNTKAGDAAVLTDKRSGYSIGTMTGSDGSIHNLNQYVVVKLKDENCWMQENLRLPGGTTITPDDSDVESEWTLPKSSSTTWNVADRQAAQMKNGAANMAVNSNSLGNGKGWQREYGNYYSWCAATAESCREDREGDPITSGQAAESICPINWQLPTGNTGGTFYVLFGKDGSNLGGDYTTRLSNVQKLPYNFPAAGGISINAQLYDPGISGGYWSSTPSPKGVSAYNLYFYGGYFNSGVDDYDRSYGYSVRCVAQGGLDKIEKPIWEENSDANINVIMPTVITIDAVAGMEDTAESNKITEGTIIAKVSGNSNHKVMLSSEQPALRDKVITTAEISPTSASNPVEPNNNAWGIWNGDTKLYDPITTTEQTYYETITNGVENQKIHTFGVGISISPLLPAGAYSTEVTVTAAVE